MERYRTNVMETAMQMCSYIIDKIALNDNREVRKVDGKVPYIRPIMINGKKVYRTKYHRIRWDAMGKAFRKQDNKRQQQYDLPLTSAMEKLQKQVHP